MLKSGIYNLVASLTRLGLSLLSIPLLIQFLGTATFGLYSIINSVVAFVALAEGSVALATTVFISKETSLGIDSKNYRVLTEACFTTTFLLASAFFILLIAASPFLADLYAEFGDNKVLVIRESLIISAFFLFLRIIQQFFVGVLQAHHQYGMYNSSYTVYFALSVVGNIILAWLKYPLQAIFYLQTLLTLACLIYYMLVCYKHGYIEKVIPSLNFKNSLFKTVFLYCFKTWPGTIGGLLFTQGDRIIVGKLLGLEIAGIYTALTSITYQINIQSASFVQPIIAYLKPSGDTFHNKYANTYALIEKAVSSNVLIVLALGLSTILFSEEIVTYFLRVKVEKSINVPIMLSTLGIIYSIYSMNAVGYYTLFAIHKELTNTLLSIVSSTFTIIMIYFGTQRFGFTGTVWGNAGYFVSLLQIPIAFKYINYKSIKTTRLYLGAVMLLVIAYITAINEMNLPIRIFLFIVIMLVVLSQFKKYIIELVSWKAKTA